jgi:uncharacterized protein (DUF2062 family)
MFETGKRSPARGLDLHPACRAALRPAGVSRPGHDRQQVGYDQVVLNLSSIVRYLWAAPTTAIGVVIVLAGFRRAKVHVVDGVLEAHGPTLAWILTNLTFLPGGAAALTLGHVVIGRDHESLESTRAHERVHVRQCEAWGPLFVPAYFAASLTAIARGRSAYSDNCFEVEAFGIERTPSASNQARRRAR